MNSGESVCHLAIIKVKTLVWVLVVNVCISGEVVYRCIESCSYQKVGCTVSRHRMLP